MPRTGWGSTRSTAPHPFSHPALGTAPGAGGDANSPTRMGGILSVLERDIVPRLVVAYQPLDARDDVGEDEEPGHIPIPHDDITELARLAVRGRFTEALARVERMLRAGASVERVLLDFIAPAARTLGDAWLEDACSFTEVTVGLGTLQQMILGLRRHDLGPADRGALLLVAAPREQHTLGLFVLAELARRAGFAVRLETAPSADAVGALVAAESYVAVGISVSTERHLPDVAELMALIRTRSMHPQIPILLGGPLDGTAFARAQGAALWARDAREALDWIEAHLTIAHAMK